MHCVTFGPVGKQAVANTIIIFILFLPCNLLPVGVANLRKLYVNVRRYYYTEVLYIVRLHFYIDLAVQKHVFLSNSAHIDDVPTF